MKSKTSCYDPATGRMTLRRFAPVWVLYTLGMLLVTVMGITGGGLPNFSTEEKLYFMKDYIRLMGLFNFGFTLVLAQLMFGDLYNSRLCYAIHALPVTRGGWFGTQIILGIVGSLLPNLLNAGVLLLFLEEYRITVLWWLAASELQFLFFFGVAALCAICAANRFGMLILYGIVNFTHLLVFWLWMKLYACLIYGMYIRDVVVPLSPLAQIMFGDQPFIIHTTPTAVPIPQQPGNYEVDYVVDGVSLSPDSWLLLAYAAVGIAAIWLAMRLYRKRRNECAGDLLAFHKLELPVLILCTLAAGGMGHLMAYIFGGFRGNMCYPLLFIGMVVGYYACLMLLKRQINVFTGKSVPLLAALCAVMLLSLALTGLDPLDVTGRVPDAQEVASVDMTFEYWTQHDTQTSDPEMIAKVLEVHQQALREHREREASRPLLTRIFGDEGREITFPDVDGENQRVGLCYIRYTMKDGSALNRVYQIPETSPAVEPMREYLSRPEVVFSDCPSNQQFVGENGSLDEFLDCVEMVTVSCSHMAGEFDSGKRSKLLDPEEIQELMDAFLEDCAQGNTAPYRMLHDDEGNVDYVTFYYTYSSWASEDIAGAENLSTKDYKTYGNEETFGIAIYPECTNTLSWLAEHGYHVPAQTPAE